MHRFILILAGVFTFSGGMAAEPDVIDAKEPTLNVSISKQSETRLAVHFILENRLAQDIYVFSPILTYDREKKKRLPDPGRLYVSWQTGQNKEAIRLSRQLWPIPDQLEVYAPEVPYLTRLLPGDSLQENLSIDLPLKIDYPYMSAFNKKKHDSVPVTMTASSVVFAVGYVSGDPGELKLESTIEGNLTIPYGIGATHQKLVERKLDVQVSVTE